MSRINEDMYDSLIFRTTPTPAQDMEMKALAQAVAHKIVEADGRGFSFVHFSQHLNKALDELTADKPTQKIFMPTGYKNQLSECYMNWKKQKKFLRESESTTREVYDCDIDSIVYDNKQVGNDMAEFGKFVCENDEKYAQRTDYQRVGLENAIDFDKHIPKIVTLNCYREWLFTEDHNNMKEICLINRCMCCKRQ